MINAADFSSLQAALNAAPGNRLIIPHGTYTAPAAGLVVPSHCDIDTDGPVVITQPQAAPVLNCSTSLDFRIVGTIALIGSAPTYNSHADWTSMPDNALTGIKLEGCDRYEIGGKLEISHCSSGILRRNSAGGWQHQGRIHGVRIQHCYAGIRSEPVAGTPPLQAEYETHSDLIISNCAFGILERCGNNTYANCKTEYCSVGVSIQGGASYPNDGHGVFTGLESNHCVYNLSCQNVTLGETFIGCHFIGGQAGSDHGTIQILNSKGINIIGGHIGADITVDATSMVCVRGNYVRPVVASLPVVAFPGVLISRDNWTDAGTMWAGNN